MALEREAPASFAAIPTFPTSVDGIKIACNPNRVRAASWKGHAHIEDAMENDNAIVLVIDDEEAMRDSCQQVLVREGYRVETAGDGESGLRKVREVRPDLVLVDLKMPRIDGMEMLGEITALDPTTVAVVITGYATVESAVEAMKCGAYDFLPKPFN